MHYQLSEKERQILEREFGTESMLSNLPGGYHRCILEEGFPDIPSTEK